MSKYVNSSMFKNNNFTGNQGNDDKNWKKNPVIMIMIIALIAALTVYVRSCTIDASLDMQDEYQKLQQSLEAEKQSESGN